MTKTTMLALYSIGGVSVQGFSVQEVSVRGGLCPDGVFSVCGISVQVGGYVRETPFPVNRITDRCEATSCHLCCYSCSTGVLLWK